MKKRLCIITGIPLLLYVVCLFFLFLMSAPRTVVPADTAIVLGNKVYPNGTPSKRLQARLNRALELYKEGVVTQIICSGGIDPKGTNEATAMATYLHQKGIPLTALLIDSLGNNTHLTAQNSTQLIQIHTKVIAVSERYHTPRCKLAFTNAGFTDVQQASPRFFELRTLYSWVREVPAYFKYHIKKL